MSHADPKDRLPLKPAVFHILLALSNGARHGLGIADEVEAASDGVLTLGPGTLYRSLDEMRRDGLVERTAPPEGEADPRRKFYEITPEGRRLLRAEVTRYQRVLDAARDRDVVPERA